MGAEAEALLERLVAFPTVAGRPNLDLVGFVAEHLEAHGAAAAVLPGERDDAANLHAVVGPRDQPGILLAAHSDVVDVEGQAWSGDPFALRRDAGRLFARGAADMKGFLAAALAVVPYAARRGLRRPLHLALSSDEELGCRGVGPLLDALADLPVRPAFCLVGEPTGLGVAVRHKGKAAARVHVRGLACHSSAAPRGVNAVEYAARLIVAAGDEGRALAARDGDPGFSVPTATLSVGPVRGGMALNTVPDACTFEIEARALPGEDAGALLSGALRGAAALEAEMRRVAPEAGIEIEPLAAYPPLAPAGDDGPAALVAGLAGGERDLAVDFGTEAGLYQQRLGVPVVVCGPGSMAQAHRPDEYVEADQVTRAEALLRGLVDTLAER
jgi:acetylornithine deacetylase